VRLGKCDVHGLQRAGDIIGPGYLLRVAIRGHGSEEKRL